nr:PTS system mannose/fructose/sorbose family transporter subunit IID [Lactiplantibacillus plantarum]
MSETTNITKKVTLSKSDRLHVWWRSTFLQGSWNYERMQNGGWAYSLIPAIKKLYTTKEDRAAALKRHMEFFNTHPYVASPVIGVTLALEEERANGAPISGSIVGPILYFVVWNAIRMGFMWYTQEFGYKAGSKITDDLSGGILQDITRGASMLGMFILAALIERWVVVDFSPVKVSTIKQQAGSYIDWDKLPKGASGVKEALTQQAAGRSLDKYKVTTLQDNLNQLIPGLMALLLTFLCMWLLKKKVSPIIIILGLFVFGVLMHVIGWM